MEYTKDVILNMNYGKKKIFNKNFKIKSWIITAHKKMENDQYFTVTMCISIIALIIDFLIIKRFVDIINLL